MYSSLTFKRDPSTEPWGQTKLMLNLFDLLLKFCCCCFSDILIRLGSISLTYLSILPVGCLDLVCQRPFV